jgi:ATP adenylyltransferase
MDSHSEAEHISRKVAEADDPILPRRLWTPWRMKYVGGDSKEEGCIFCNRLAAINDVESLILRRGRFAFVIMNLFPYNTGHVMVVPNQHVADLEDLSEEALSDMGQLAFQATRAIRRALNPAGFNLGMNIGAVAGAGVADHLHQHIVPRWQGDANFMPILAGAVVMPELIPATYAKIRAELQRSDAKTISLAIFTQNADKVLVADSGALPAIEVIPNEPASRTATKIAQSLVSDVGLIGWAGNTLADEGGRIALAFLALTSTQPTQGNWIDTTVALVQLHDDDDRLTLANALKLDFTVIDAPPGRALKA